MSRRDEAILYRIINSFLVEIYRGLGLGVAQKDEPSKISIYCQLYTDNAFVNCIFKILLLVQEGAPSPCPPYITMNLSPVGRMIFVRVHKSCIMYWRMLGPLLDLDVVCNAYIEIPYGIIHVMHI